jgi:hypothetical protein
VPYDSFENVNIVMEVWLWTILKIS